MSLIIKILSLPYFSFTSKPILPHKIGSVSFKFIQTYIGPWFEVTKAEVSNKITNK